MKHFVVALVLLAAGCSSPAACNGSTCSGCCDARGICQPGSLGTACGVMGASCGTCSSSQFCRLGSCAENPEPQDAGPPPVCDPPPQSTFEICQSLIGFGWCAAQESDEELRLARFCPTTSPEARSLRARCGEVVGLLEQRGSSSTATVRECWYLDGGLVGGAAFTDTGTLIAGTRPPKSSCTFDAGCATCAPAPPIGLPCVALTFAAHCGLRLSEHTSAVCMRDPSARRQTCGAVETWTETNTAAVDECFFEDGGLIGFTRTAVDGGDFVGGRWSFVCVPADGGC